MNYIVSVPNATRQIKTNTAGLCKSIKVLLDEGYESVNVIPEIAEKQQKQPKFKVGDEVRIIEEIDDLLDEQFEQLLIEELYDNDDPDRYKSEESEREY